MTYRKTKVSYPREVYYIACLIAVLAGMVFSVWGPTGYLEMKRWQEKLDRQRYEIETLKRTKSERIQTIQGLKSDPAAQEKYARDKGYAKPGEKIQHLPPKSTPGSPEESPKGR